MRKKEDLLSRFLETNETDPKYLKDIILSFIIAGKDTTASTLSWFFYMICSYPHLQEKIADEVMKATNVQEKNFSISELANSITEEALDKMQYLHAALTETLRLYPSVPVVIKLIETQTSDYLEMHIYWLLSVHFRMVRCAFRMIYFRMDTVSRKEMLYHTYRGLWAG